MNSLELISLYKNVATLTNDMLEAARNEDWDKLTQLETTCTSKVQCIRESEIPMDLPVEVRDEKIRIIKDILAKDREIRDLTEPWMAKLSDLMKNSNTSRKLSRAYGATSSA
ncbi:MAG: flagellar protein FliT [Burkholderiales bacterium]|nr:flagellar protein FliT [Burkholderiales bacterium]